YPGEDRLHRIAGPEMDPVLFRIVIEADEVLPVPQHVLGSSGLAGGPQLLDVLIAQSLALRLGVRGPHRMEASPGLRLEPFRELVLHVQDAVIPAPLVLGRREHLVERGPEPEPTIADGQERRREPPIAEVPEQLLPALLAFAVAELQGQELLRAVLAGSNDGQEGRLVLLAAHSQVDAIRPHIRVLMRPERSLRPGLVLLGPMLLEPHHRRGREGRRLAYQLPKHRLEVAGGEPFEIEAGEEGLRPGRGPLIPLDDSRLEAIGRDLRRDVRHAGDAHVDRAHPDRQLALRQMPVPVAAEGLAALVAGPAQKGGDFLLEGGGQHAAGSFPNDGLQGVVDGLGRRLWGWAVVSSRQGVSLQFISPPGVVCCAGRVRLSFTQAPAGAQFPQLLRLAPALRRISPLAPESVLKCRQSRAAVFLWPGLGSTVAAMPLDGVPPVCPIGLPLPLVYVGAWVASPGRAW